MRERQRVLLFLAGAVGVAAIYGAGIRNLPRWAEYRGPYGDVIAGLAVYQRHATDTVNAITYDYRGFDTLGEEFILFSAVTGVMLLLRPTKEKDGKGQQQNPASFRDSAALSETVQVFTTAMFGFSLLFGFYIGTHGQLTPGGGLGGGDEGSQTTNRGRSRARKSLLTMPHQRYQSPRSNKHKVNLIVSWCKLAKGVE